jgi:hypothetical protein
LVTVRDFVLSNNSENTKLLDNRYIILVIRLLVDKDGNIQQGNLIDLDEKIAGQFRQLDELPELVRAWIETSITPPDGPSKANDPLET